MKIDFKNTVYFKGKMSDRVKKALTSEDDYILKAYYEDIKNFRPLPRAEERKLAQQIQQGGEEADFAKEKLLKSVLPYIVYTASCFVNRGMSLADMIQEGNYAVVKLCESVPYDGKKSFQNFVYYRIVQSIARAIEDKSRLITIPNDVCWKFKKINKAEKNLILEGADSPTIEEIAERTGLSKEKVESIRRYSQPIEHLTTKKLDKISMDKYAKNSRYEDEIGRVVDNNALREKLQYYLSRSCFTDMEKTLVTERFNLDGANRKNTLEEIGKIHHVTRERVRQVIAKGLRKLAVHKRTGSMKRNGILEFLEYEKLGLE